MPWRLIGFILLFGIFLVFIGFNLDHNCDISFGFVRFSQVPVYLTAFSSFVFGMLCAIPFAISMRSKKKQKNSGAGDGPSASPRQDKKPHEKMDKKEKELVSDINHGNYGID